MAYGVLPTGFARKPLPVILGEIEEAAKAVFGEGVIQTPQSPLGQLNGMLASILTTAWEIGESTYQSFDPDQAEGVRLEQLGRIRLLDRMTGELDPSYRQAITNAGRARIDLADILRAVGAVDGVSYAQVFVNSTGTTNQDGLPSHSIAVAVLGGADEEVAAALRPYVVPGIDAFGNTRVDLVIDGYCRSVSFVRPALVALGLDLLVKVGPDRLGCPAPSAIAIGIAAANALSGANRPPNGKDVTLHMIRAAVAAVYPNVEVITAAARLLPDDEILPLPYVIKFAEIADIAPANVTVAIQ